jgi:predicted methyltransferase
MLNIRSCLLATTLILPTLILPTFIQTAYAADNIADKNVDNNAVLIEVIAARSDEEKARDVYRHPVETLTFFQVEPGMTVVEGLPGGGWYTRILANYLGADGALYGVNYPDRIWPMVRPGNAEWAAERIAATGNFPAEVATYTDNGIAARGFTFETVPPEVAGTVDRVLMIRALHNLNRFETQAQTLTKALEGIRTMLKDDGLVGVVQHRAPATASAEWADGSRGYLNQAAVIASFEKAGFELVAESEINANPLDKPTGDDSVWRLPPSLRGNENDPEKQAAMLAIGETDRMTLLFRKAP